MGREMGMEGEVMYGQIGGGWMEGQFLEDCMYGCALVFMDEWMDLYMFA